MELLSAAEVAELLGEPEAGIKHACDRFVFFIPMVRIGQDRWYPTEAFAVLRIICDQLRDGVSEERVEAVLRKRYPGATLLVPELELTHEVMQPVAPHNQRQRDQQRRRGGTPHATPEELVALHEQTNALADLLTRDGGQGSQSSQGGLRGQRQQTEPDEVPSGVHDESPLGVRNEYQLGIRDEIRALSDELADMRADLVELQRRLDTPSPNPNQNPSPSPTPTPIHPEPDERFEAASAANATNGATGHGKDEPANDGFLKQITTRSPRRLGQSFFSHDS